MTPLRGVIPGRAESTNPESMAKPFNTIHNASLLTGLSMDSGSPASAKGYGMTSGMTKTEIFR